MKYSGLSPLDEAAPLGEYRRLFPTPSLHQPSGLGLFLDEKSIDPTHQLFRCYGQTQIRCDLTLECGRGATLRSELSLRYEIPTLFVLDFDDVAASTPMPKWLRLGKREWQIRLRCLWILLYNQCSFVTVQFDNAQRLS